jgi:hypothetical protein
MTTKPIEYAIQRREALRRETEFLEGVIAALQEVHRLSEQVRQLSEWAKSAGFAEHIGQEQSAARDSLARDVARLDERLAPSNSEATVGTVKTEIYEPANWLNALNASVEATLANLVNSSTNTALCSFVDSMRSQDAAMRQALNDSTRNIDDLASRFLSSTSSDDTWKHTMQEILQRQREQQDRFSNLSLSDIFHGSQRLTLRDRIVSEARAILRDGKPRGTKELLDLLEQRGVRIGGTQQIANLSAYLSKADEFVSDRGRGGWMLRQQWLKAVTGEKETPQKDAGT